MGDRRGHAVGALAGILDHRVAGIVDIVAVVAGAAAHRVGAGAAAQTVVAAVRLREDGVAEGGFCRGLRCGLVRLGLGVIRKLERAPLAAINSRPARNECKITHISPRDLILPDSAALAASVPFSLINFLISSPDIPLTPGTPFDCRAPHAVSLLLIYSSNYFF